MTFLALQFLTLPWWGVVLGLAAIAAAFFVLHRLRIRFREEVVPTTMFWKQALDERQARVLMQRFRHPWTYVLATSIGALLWLAAARPTGQEAHTTPGAAILWDTSLRAESIETSRRALLSLAARIEGRAPRVIVCDDDPRSILAPGESARLLPERAERVEVHRSRSSVVRVLDDLEQAQEGRDSLDVYVVGAREALPAARWQRLRVSRISSGTAQEEDAGSTEPQLHALGVTAAASGLWDRVDVFLRVRGDEPPRATVDTKELPLTRVESGIWVARDVAARGDMLTVTAGRESAIRVLPTRSVIAVTPHDNGVDSSDYKLLRRVIRLDSGLTYTGEGSPRVTLGVPSADVPSLSVDDASNRVGISLVVPPALEADAKSFASSWSFPSVDRRVADEYVAGELSIIVTVDAKVGAPQLTLGSVLLSDNSNFTSSPLFPSFVSGALRFLAGEYLPLALDVAVGDGVVVPVGAVRSPMEQETFSVDGVFVPTIAGVYRLSDGSSLAATLLSPPAASVSAQPVESTDRVPVDAVEASGRPLTWSWVLGALTLALLLFEWVLVRRERIP